jgi:hypothetical protein
LWHWAFQADHESRNDLLMEVIMINSTSSLDAGLNRAAFRNEGRDPADVRNPKAADGRDVSAAASARNQLNVQILQSSLEVSISAGGKSQELVFRAAIERINELLAPEAGPDAIQGAMSQDNSAEATAGRILSLSLGFYEAYAAQRPDADPNQTAQDFVTLIRGGFEQGFNDAKDILTGLGVFKGDVENGVMKTFDLVQKGLDDFLAGKLTPAPTNISET